MDMDEDNKKCGLVNDIKDTTYQVCRQKHDNDDTSTEILPNSKEVGMESQSVLSESLSNSKRIYQDTKIQKQLSLPETSEDFNMTMASLKSGVNHSKMILSPNESSNTLTESMYTASDGMRSSRSGITSFSGNMDFYMTPNEASFASFTHSDLSSLDHLVYYSCHSNLRLMLENENNEKMESECKDNEENETKLRGLESVNKVTSKGSLKSKFLKGIQKRHSSKKKPSHEHTQSQCLVNQPVQLLVKTDLGTNQVTSKVIHGILKTSVSSDSDCAKLHEPDNKIAGKKTLLIEKVSN
jgi:hypothetical protein